MTFNASRLTCFALLSALETDARDLVLGLEIDGPITWPTTAEGLARERYERERGPATDISHASLVGYLDFPDAYQILLGHKQKVTEPLKLSLGMVGPQLAELTSIRNRVAHNRPLEINDLPALSDIAKALLRQSRSDWGATRATLDRLENDPSYVLGLTIRLRVDPIDEPFHNLPVPDFDETGFFGRSNALRQVKRAILGPWPAISILGDGGIGKTSIALKAAYDILDDPKANFDAIVWTTAKSTTLTSHEIGRINDAILSSLGLFEDAAKQLGYQNQPGGDPIAELLDYLATFRVLLILDNLETVMDKRLRDFLRDLPHGSKVLITSRIGLQMENPIKLEPLSPDESRQLFMALVHRRNVSVLKSLDTNGVDKLVAKLKGHPLYIKWLVAGVQSGRRPSEIVSDNDLLLDYCMSNVFDKLGKDSRAVLQSMQIMRGTRLQAELAYLNGMNARAIQSALLELMATNFVSMTQSGVDELEASYEVGDFASTYLSRKQPPSSDFRAKIIRQSDALSKLGLKLASESRLDKFDPRSIDIRGQQDVPVARLLSDVQRELKANRFDRALELCHEAQTLSPGYHEAWRIEGLVQTRRRDHSAALLAYERATELAAGTPSELIADYHCASFLIYESMEYERALVLLHRAAKSDSSSPQIVYQIAACHFQLQRYNAALDATIGLVGMPVASAHLYDAALLGLRATSFGCADDLWNGRLGKALELIERTVELSTAIPVELFDDQLTDWLIRVLRLTEQVEVESSPEPFLFRRAREFRTSLEQRARVVDVDSLMRRIGWIKNISVDKSYAFVFAGDEEFFFHRNEFMLKSEWERLTVNSLVAFTVAEPGPKGLRAKKVRLLD